MTTNTDAAPAPIDILLVGLGSIGTVYALLLEKSGRARVTAVARSNYELYSTTGVKIDSDALGVIEGWKPYRGGCEWREWPAGPRAVVVADTPQSSARKRKP